MKIENGRIVLERKNCFRCQEGKVTRRITCPECQGTGNGKRGGKRQCRKCSGTGHNWTWDNPEVCPNCKGNYVNAEPENDCDYLDRSEIDKIPVRVIRNGPGMTVGESLIGLGCVYSSTGGQYDGTPDSHFIDEWRKSGRHQACKFIDESGNVCKEVGIFVYRHGYAVKTLF